MNRKELNILFLYWGKKGGGAKYSLEISRELSRRDDIRLHLSVSRQCELIDQFKALKAPVFYVNTYESLTGFLRTYFIRKYEIQRKLRRYLEKNEVDVVIIGMDFFWGPVINKAAKEAGAKTVFVVHEPKPHPQESLAMTFFKNRNLKKSIPGADHIVALTDHVKDLVADLYEVQTDHISVIPHGIFSYYKTEIPRRLKHDRDNIKILYFGRIDYYKGLDILLDAFTELEQVRDDVQLEVWGAGDLSPYEHQIQNLQNVRIENRWLGEDEIGDVFKECDLCVLPYREASQSGVVGIASHAAMPVVACPSAGLKEQLKDYGAVLSNDFTSRSLKNALLNVIDDPDLYHRLSEQAVEYGHQISWEAIADDFYEISSSLYSSSE